jgi:hypothetical protein
LRCLEEVQKYVRDIEVKRWRQKAVERKEWASVNMGSKALRGP